MCTVKIDSTAIAHAYYIGTCVMYDNNNKYRRPRCYLEFIRFERFFHNKVTYMLYTRINNIILIT